MRGVSDVRESLDAAATPSLVVAIDGPSGSGKSSVSRAVAARLGLAYLDTGAMYRALTWWCIDQGIDLGDEAAVTAAAERLPLRMGTDPGDPRVFVGDTDVTAAIRETRISSVVSAVARHLPTRAVLIGIQRDLIARGSRPGIIAEGRDITTVVAPDADLRLLLTASEHARLMRRAREQHGDAGETALAATRDEVVRRDRDDSMTTSFLVPTDGVQLLDTSELDFESTVAVVVDAIEAVRRAASAL
ncbi:(d)CMP kinase [Mobilicoccus massiliensis]|uniref:(d)CMP kinase n=1 Tax=Mobilicoccus massiliensis TaxID=1522310 RepID=UPI0009E4244D